MTASSAQGPKSKVAECQQQTVWTFSRSSRSKIKCFAYLKQDIDDEDVEYILQRDDNTVKNSLELWNTIDCLEGAQHTQEL